MIQELEELALTWEKEARSYMKVAAIVAGSQPDMCSPQQTGCSYSSGSYRNCAHELRKLIKKHKTATPAR